MAEKRERRFRVGLLGESPNDTKAIEALLKPRYGERVEFFTLLRNVNGDMLEYAETFRSLRKEYEWEKPNLVIVIRDLDGLATKGAKWRQRQAYFRKVDAAVEQKSLPLLNIYEIEALICAHIAVFNRHYGCACPQPADPMAIKEPKEWLRAATEPGRPRYSEGHSCMVPEYGGVALRAVFKAGLWEKYHMAAPAQRRQLGSLSSKVQKAYKS